MVRMHRSEIPGWGADLDRRQRPGVPMEHMPPRLDHVPDPEPQQSQVEILQTIERAGITPVYGTRVPPSGLSGWIRRRAFRHSENNLRHWMMLLMADRVNVVEGLLQDYRRNKPRLHALAVAGAGLLAMWWWVQR